MGYLFVIIASVLFGTVPSIEEYVLRQGTSPLGLVVICASSAAVVSLAAGVIRKESFRVSGKTLLSLVLAGGVGFFLTGLLLGYAYSNIPVGLATMIHFLYPTVVSAAMMLFFGERFRVLKIAAIVLSLCGLFLLFGGNFSSRRMGMLAALASSFCYAFYIISNDRPAVTAAPLMVRTFYINISSAAAALIVNMFTRSVVIPFTAATLVPGAVAGVMLSAGLMLLAAGISRLGASKAAFLNMLEPITSMIVSSIAAGMLPGWLTLAGSLLIVASLVVYAMCDRKTQCASN